MELRRVAVILAFFVIGSFTCLESHSMHKRATDDDVIYDDTQADEANDDYAQNDTGAEPEKQEVPAVIVTRPETYEISPGKTIRLSCKVEPDNGTVVQWLKDGEMYFLGSFKINQDATRFSLVPGSKDLLIKDVVHEDSGVYRCEVVKRSSASISHTVIVTKPPRILRLTASNGGSVKEGDNLLLTCEVEGIPPPQIVWSKQEEHGNERLKEQDGEFKGNTVSMQNVRRNHTGKYYCYAFNNAGHSQSEIQVRVYGKPTVHVTKTVVNSAINVEAVLQCSTHKDTDAHMRWYKDGKLIEDSSSQYSVTTHGVHTNLTVTPVSDQDFGTFTCEAENKHGRHNSSIELTQSPIIENLDADGPKMTWIVDSHQDLEEIEVQLRSLNGDKWTREAVPLPEKKGHLYEVTYIVQDSQLQPGKYEAYVKVKNTNSWSGAKDPVQVEIESQPLLIQTASVIGEGGNHAHSTKSTSTILAAFFIYLLVRMF